MRKTLNSSTYIIKRHLGIIIAFATILAATAAIELTLGRSLFGPDGKFGLWEGSIWSSENSQRLADPYSFSHIVHGILLYAVLWYTARKISVHYRFLIAAIIEASWELMENSPFIIERYRAVTISLGYVGDSVLNSLSDIVMLAIGFLFAYHVKPRIALITVLVMEIGCAFWVRDNLTLNIIMLIYPIDAIKQWQLAVAPQS
jgi:hypothetical protein